MAGFTKLTRKGNSYANIDSIPEDLIKVEYEKDKKTGDTVGFKKPAKKKWAVEHNGTNFEVASKVQTALKQIWFDWYETYDEEDDEDFDDGESAAKYYDPSMLLKMCKEYNIPPEGYIHDGTATGTEKRDAHKWWWKQELPTRKEYDQAHRNLKRHNNTVDFIITHEAPGVVLHRLGLPQNEVSNKLWELYDHTAFGMWYCGHHHIDRQYGKVRLLYDDIDRIDNLESYQLSR